MTRVVSQRRARLVIGLSLVTCCSSTPSSPTGLFSTPAGLALSGTTLLISNQDDDELHAFDTVASEFVPAPNVLFPLSIPTVNRPGALCADDHQAFVASTVDPRVGVIDTFDDVTSHLPATGLRELGELDVPGVVTGMVCAPDPAQVKSRETALAGSPAAYQAMVDAGEIVVDGPGGLAPDGGPDERHALAALPTAAIASVAGSDGTTTFYAIGNDITGASCPDAGAIESCGADAGSGCTGPSVFCPSLVGLLSMPSQPAACNPVGPPVVGGFDVVGGNAGSQNLGAPTAEPAHANLLVASDRNSTCAAAIDLGSGTTTWMQANAPTLAVAALPFYPGTCVSGGAIFAAALDSENCEQTGPPPPGGYDNCNGIVFFDPSAAPPGDPNPLDYRVRAPVPYPFQRANRVLPPVRVYGIVQSLAFTGPGLNVGSFNASLPTAVPVQDALIVGTTVGDLDYIDIGFGSEFGGTGNGDGGGYPCPPAYFAPRILDQADYVAGLATPSITAVSATNGSGTSLGFAANGDQPMTSDGGVLPQYDRLGKSFLVAPSGHAAVTCYGAPGAAAGSFDVCVTDGMVQHGAAEDETITITYRGAISGLGGLAGTVNGATLESSASTDLSTYLNGLLVLQQPNLEVTVNGPSGACGGYLVASVQSSSLTLVPESGGSPLSCAQGSVTFTVAAGGDAPYAVQGSESGFLGLWPANGTLRFVTTGRWQYPADLIAMGRGAQQLADIVYGTTPAGTAPGSALATLGPHDDAALDAAFGLALMGVPPGGGVDGGAPDGGVDAAPGTTITLTVVSGVSPLSVNPEDTSALIDAMASYTDTGGVPHVYASYRGNNTLIELNPDEAIFSALSEIH
jgi:hypothetical protein